MNLVMVRIHDGLWVNPEEIAALRHSVNADQTIIYLKGGDSSIRTSLSLDAVIALLKEALK